MNNKPNKKSWFDVKVFIASLGFLFTVGLWNTFSKELVKTSSTQTPPPNQMDRNPSVSTPIIPTRQPTAFTRILMGAAAPQVYLENNSASEPITQTSSSK